MQISFENPLYISALGEGELKDSLEATFWNSNLFVSFLGLLPIKNDTVVEMEIPMQLEDSWLATEDSNFAQGLSIMMIIFYGAFSAIMNYILGFVRSLSVITHMMILDVDTSANTRAFFSNVFMIVAFDMIPIDGYIDMVFGFNNVPFSEKFE